MFFTPPYPANAWCSHTVVLISPSLNNPKGLTKCLCVPSHQLKLNFSSKNLHLIQLHPNFSIQKKHCFSTPPPPPKKRHPHLPTPLPPRHPGTQAIHPPYTTGHCHLWTLRGLGTLRGLAPVGDRSGAREEAAHVGALFGEATCSAQGTRLGSFFGKKKEQVKLR